MFSCSGVNCTDDISECDAEPCLHNGVCVEDALNSFICDCPPGVEGSLCSTILKASFDANAYLVIPAFGDSSPAVLRRKRATSFAQELSVILELETTIAQGVILFASGVSLCIPIG